MWYSAFTALLILFTVVMFTIGLVGLLPGRRKWLWRLRFLIVAWMAIILPWAYWTKQIAGRSVGTEYANPAPNARFEFSDGRKISIAEMRGKVILLDFWATWCYPCRNTVPVVTDLAESRKSDGLVVIGVSRDTDERAWREYIAAHPSPRLEVRDGNGELTALFNFQATPGFVLIDRQGTTRWTLEGWTPYGRWILGRKVGEILRSAF